MWGLPGGSTSEGPATTAGCVFVALVTAVVFAGLVGFLFYAVSFIEGL
jgi:hypothetical protein